MDILHGCSEREWFDLDLDLGWMFFDVDDDTHSPILYISRPRSFVRASATIVGSVSLWALVPFL